MNGSKIIQWIVSIICFSAAAAIFYGLYIGDTDISAIATVLGFHLSVITMIIGYIIWDTGEFARCMCRDKKYDDKKYDDK